MEPLAVYGLNVFDDLVRRVHVKKQTFMMHGPAQFCVNTYRQGNFILAEICWNHHDNDRPFDVVGRGIAKRSAWDVYDEADGIRLAVRRALDSMRLD